MPRPCVYCGAPWPDEILPIEHKPDCPSVTNLWPVQSRDMDHGGFGCCGCEQQFRVGDCYVQVAYEDENGHTDPDVVEVLCLTCAASKAGLTTQG